MSAQAALKTQPEIRLLHGPEKVAALLLAAGKPIASRLLKHFDPAELKEITRSAAELGSVSAGELETLIEEFAHQFAAGMSLLGTAREVEKLLTGVLPGEQIAEIMSDVLGRGDSTIWERASSIPQTAIAEFLKREHPQTAALILSKLKSESSAKALATLPPPLRQELMRRMLSLKPISDVALRLLEEGIHEELILGHARHSRGAAHARAAEIINNMKPEEIEELLGGLAEQRPEEAAALKGMLFRFEDIRRLSTKGRAALFDQVPSERVVLALSGMDQPFCELVLSSLAARARRIVEAELASGDPPPPKSVADARRQVAEQALAMIRRDEIELNDAAEPTAGSDAKA
jgi:flagellar motor switch protein FliG